MGTSTLAITRPSSSSSQPPVQHRALVVVSVAVRRVCELVNWLKSSTWRYCDNMCILQAVLRVLQLIICYCKAARIRMVYIRPILCLLYIILMIYVYDYVMFSQVFYSEGISSLLLIILY